MGMSNYIKGLRQGIIKGLEMYYEKHIEDLFSQLTIEAREILMKKIARMQKRRDVIS